LKDEALKLNVISYGYHVENSKKSNIKKQKSNQTSI